MIFLNFLLSESLFCTLHRVKIDSSWFDLQRLRVSWLRHQMETFSALLARRAGNSLVTSEFPSQGPVTRSFWCFLWSAPWINGWVNNREAGDLRRHRAHYDVVVMLNLFQSETRKFSLCGCGWRFSDLHQDQQEDFDSITAEVHSQRSNATNGSVKACRRMFDDYPIQWRYSGVTRPKWAIQLYWEYGTTLVEVMARRITGTKPMPKSMLT